jgi:hypothetical protein
LRHIIRLNSNGIVIQILRGHFVIVTSFHSVRISLRSAISIHVIHSASSSSCGQLMPNTSANVVHKHVSINKSAHDIGYSS